MRSGYGQATLPAGDFTQGTGPFHHIVASVEHLLHLSQVPGHGRGVNHKRFRYVGGHQVRPVLVVYGNPFLLQLGRELGGCTVISRHVVSLELVVAGQCGHPDSADSYKVNVLHISL